MLNLTMWFFFFSEYQPWSKPHKYVHLFSFIYNPCYYTVGYNNNIKKKSLCTKMDEQHTVCQSPTNAWTVNISYNVTYLWLESKYVTKKWQGKSSFNFLFLKKQQISPSSMWKVGYGLVCLQSHSWNSSGDNWQRRRQKWWTHNSLVKIGQKPAKRGRGGSPLTVTLCWD